MCRRLDVKQTVLQIVVLESASTGDPDLSIAKHYILFILI